jgi:hypothetical protein
MVSVERSQRGIHELADFAERMTGENTLLNIE